jgi:hypothetical protein
MLYGTEGGSDSSQDESTSSEEASGGSLHAQSSTSSADLQAPDPGFWYCNLGDEGDEGSSEGTSTSGEREKGVR